MLLKGLEIKSAKPVEDIHKFFTDEMLGQKGSFSFDKEGALRAKKSATMTVAHKLRKVPTKEEVKSLLLARNMPWQEGYEKRIAVSVGSDESVDSDGDIVLQNWDFSQFENNPAMPFGHDWGGLPVGAHIDWDVKGSGGTRFLELVSLYALAADMDPKYGDSIFRLTRAGMLRMNSVGFRPKSVIHVESEEDRQALGLGRYGVVIEEAVLLENSPTLMGANYNAFTHVRNHAKTGKLKAADLNLFHELQRVQFVRNNDEAGYISEQQQWKAAIEDLFDGHMYQVSTDIEEGIDPDNGFHCAKGVWYIGAKQEVAEPEPEPEHTESEDTDTESTLLSAEVTETIKATAEAIAKELVGHFETLSKAMTGTVETLRDQLIILSDQGHLIISDDVKDMLDQLEDVINQNLDDDEPTLQSSTSGTLKSYLDSLLNNKEEQE